MFSIRNNTYFYRNYFDICLIEGVVKTMLYKKEMVENIESLREENKKLNKEIERLNNIINKALEKSKGLQYRYGYVLDDLVYLLMQGGDKE